MDTKRAATSVEGWVASWDGQMAEAKAVVTESKWVDQWVERWDNSWAGGSAESTAGQSEAMTGDYWEDRSVASTVRMMAGTTAAL